jgi:hypothetical protein
MPNDMAKSKTSAAHGHIQGDTAAHRLRGRTVAASMPTIGGGGLAGLASVAVILFVAMIPFFAFRNLSLVLGADRLKSLLFGASGTDSRRLAAHVDRR